jgi:hypothetical protein
LTDTAARFATVRRRAAAALLVLGAVAYPIAWNVDPYVFGFLVLGLGPLQAGVALLGIVWRLARRPADKGCSSWLIDALLIASAVAAFVAVRSISWT